MIMRWRTFVMALVSWMLLSGSVMGQQTEGRYTYKEFDGIYVFYKPRDLKTYRELLPQVFDMPQTPLAQVFVADYYKMDAATQPYLEAAVFLLAHHESKKAWHCITMPVTSDEARRLGVMFLGFPKVMGDIGLQRGDGHYTGTLKLDGNAVLSIKLTTQGYVLTPQEKQWFQDLAGIPSLNILNGKVIDPMGGRPRGRFSLLEMARMFPEKVEVRPGKAELSLRPRRARADAFGIEPAEIVLAYYVKNKFGFSFGGRGTQPGAEK